MKFEVINESLERYKELIQRLEVEDSGGLKDILNTKDFDDLKTTLDTIADLESIASSVVGGIAAGTLAGFGAFGGAGLLASASTGIVISTLSGVAATNALL